MVYIFFLTICFGASVIGAICGIGGGVIIKPILDSCGIFDVQTISFLSGCTVLSMTTYMVLKDRTHKVNIDEKKVRLPLAFGAAFGGILGKWIFQLILNMSNNKDSVGAVQATCLLLVTLGSLVYTLNSKKIATHHVKNTSSIIFIGLVLGFLSSFLGIGGGPINLIVLFYFFSMETKIATKNSLYIIFFSQIASLIQSFLTKKIPDYSIGILFIMIIGGVFGGMFGRLINQRISGKTVNLSFIGIMILMIFVNIFNVFKFI